jgi:hypothetical protein
LNEKLIGITMSDEGQLGAVQYEQSANNLLDPSYAQFRDQTRFWIQRVAVPLIMVVGLFGNLITVIIMTRRRMRSTTNMYLAALALVDMLYLVLTFLLGLSHYPNMAKREYYLYWRLRPFLMMFTDACSNTSVWLTVTFTIERFIAVKYPMKGKVWCTEARARKLIVFVFAFGIIFASPVPFEWKVVEKPLERKHTIQSVNITNVVKPQSDTDSLWNLDIFRNGSADDIAIAKTLSDLKKEAGSLQSNDDDRAKWPTNEQEPVDDNSYSLSLENTDFGRNETYKTIYYWSTAVIFCFIPLLSLTFFNGFLILSVHRSFRERKLMTTGQQTHSRNHQNQCQQTRDSRVKRGRSSSCRRNQLIIPKISIETKQASIQESRHDDDKLIVRMKTRIPTDDTAPNGGTTENKNHKSNTCLSESVKCKSYDSQHELISRSNSEVTDKMVHAEHDGGGRGGSNVSGRDEINGAPPFGKTTGTENSTTRYHADRRVEFNCDSNAADAGDGDTSKDVQIDCDKKNNSNRTIMELGKSAGEKSSTESGSKSAIVVPILRTNHETPSGLPSTDAAQQTNQLVPDGAGARGGGNGGNDESDISGSRSPKITAESGSAHTDNAVTLTRTSGFHKVGQHSCSVSAQVAKAAGSPKTADTNNKSYHRESEESTSHDGGKFHLINSTVCSSGGFTSNSNYDSGSCTTIQTTASTVPVSSQERHITIMLIAVVILFLCCQIPSAAMLLYTSVRETIPNTNEHALLLAFGNIFNFLMAVNAAGNFILYSFLSKKYRKTFMILFCDCFKRRNSDSDERQRAYGGYLSPKQQSMVGGGQQALKSPGGSFDERMTRLGRWTGANFVRKKLGLTKQPTLRSDDTGNYLVDGGGGGFAKQQRTDTLV